MSERLSKRRLEEIATTLGDRDKAVLSAIRHCRYLTTEHARRLHFTDAANSSAGLRAANRNLHKLKEMGLTDTLDQRIGGVRAGSSSLVWQMTRGGERLMRLIGKGAQFPMNPDEHSPFFLAHTLAIAECYVQFTELCRGKGLNLVRVELEPECWRPYSHKGKPETLKPDLFAVTHCDDYEDRWFIEVDLDTQAPVRVVDKCRRYHEYYRSGKEQAAHKMLPLSVWIVPDAARKESLTKHIRNEFKELPNIFIVITPDELERLIRQGADRTELC